MAAWFIGCLGRDIQRLDAIRPAGRQRAHEQTSNIFLNLLVMISMMIGTAVGEAVISRQ